MSRRQKQGFRVCQNRQSWSGFDLLQGHIFGNLDGEKYVSACFETRPGYIRVYKYTETANTRWWSAISVSVKSELGNAIMFAKKTSLFDEVQFPEDRPRGWRGSNNYTEEIFRHVSAPAFITMNQKRSGHVTVTPRPTPRSQTWVDAICKEVLSV